MLCITIMSIDLCPWIDAQGSVCDDINVLEECIAASADGGGYGLRGLGVVRCGQNEEEQGKAPQPRLRRGRRSGRPNHERPVRGPTCCASPSCRSIRVLGSTRRALCAMIYSSPVPTGAADTDIGPTAAAPADGHSLTPPNTDTHRCLVLGCPSSLRFAIFTCCRPYN